MQKSISKVRIIVCSAVAIACTQNLLAADNQATIQNYPLTSFDEVKHDTSQTLINVNDFSIPHLIQQSREKLGKHKVHRDLSSFNVIPHADSASQLMPGDTNPLLIKFSFQGISYGWKGYSSYTRSDVNGSVGLDQYVQVINDMMAIFDKHTGNLISGPIPLKNLWAGFGKPCEKTKMLYHDPVVLYDKIAQRWIITHIGDLIESGNPIQQQDTQCVAVSTSSDARGTYHRYAFAFKPNSETVDYTKFGVWPDGYYMSNNGEPSACVLDRINMLAGNSAKMQCVVDYKGKGLGNLTILPSDFDGTPPPEGTPNYFATLDFDNKDFSTMHFYQFHVDWSNVKNSKFSGPIDVAVAPFSPAMTKEDYSDVIPQPSTSDKLDSVADFLMFRLAYRSQSDGTATLTVNHTVFAKENMAGIRWYEFKILDNQQISLVQQGTFAPNNIHRWMGSIAVDKQGNMALGYNVSSSEVFPGIRITGRFRTDPLGIFRDEKTVLDGHVSLNNDRWGDYTSMSLDPEDGCTFWYTAQYNIGSSSNQWGTHVVAFKFPNCQ